MDMTVIDSGSLRDLCVDILVAEGFGQDVSTDIVDVLLEADLRGIPSHGVARLKRYIDERNAGHIKLNETPSVKYETPLSAVVDGRGGPGQSVSKWAMNLAIEKAGNNLAGFVSVRNSNHYGITAYYSEMALKRDMIGIAMTNSYPLVVPTFGREAVLGTNPFSIAIPGSRHPFILDMATSVVTRGKLEVYDRLAKVIPGGWAVDSLGADTNSPGEVLANFNNRRPGGILPLGGSGEEFGGHKGFGLSLLVDLVSAGLSLGSWSALTYSEGVAGVCHFFGAINLRLFGEPESLKRQVQSIIDGVVSSGKACGSEKIYYHGEKEELSRISSLSKGVTLDPKTVRNLVSLAEKNNLTIPDKLLQ